MSDIHMIKSPWVDDFPALKTEVYGKALHYLDTAASAQTPQSVADRMAQYYQRDYASVHRGAYYLSQKATQNMEAVRQQVAGLLNAPSEQSIIFTKGTTEGINLVANSYLRPLLQPGDEIIVTEMEHHANLVPWQMLAEMCSAVIKVWRLTESCRLALDDLQTLISDRTQLIAVAHVSNVLGQVNAIQEITSLAKLMNIRVLVDGAQAILHQAVDVQALGCDFYVFSGHKLYGPTGIGALYVHPSLIDNMRPWEGGGSMIERVVLPTGTIYGRAPWKFEAGTPNIAGIIGLGAAIEYLSRVGLEKIAQYEQRVMDYFFRRLQSVPSVEIYGQEPQRKGVISFNLDGLHAYDVGAFLDRYGIAIRTGHHCAMPLIKKLGQTTVCRASIGMYTQSQDIDALIDGLTRINQLLR